MPDPSACRTADFFVLRTPGLPEDALDGGDLEAAMRALVCEDAVREALALASPDLAARLDPWLAGTLDAAEERHLARALLRYLGRMSGRATPFGLFAAVSLGAWGPSARFEVGPWRASRKALRLDWGVLEALAGGLERDPAVRAGLRYRPNTSLHTAGGWHRYLERRDAEARGRTYHLEAVEATPHLDFALQEARAGLPLAALAERLAARVAVPPDEARAFLDQVVEAQVLAGDLQPPLTAPDPLAHLAARLGPAGAAEPLTALASEVAALAGAPLGAHPGGYAAALPALAALPVPPGGRDLLQVDLHRPAPGLALPPRVRRALEAGAETLRRLAAPPAEGPLDRFRAAFTDRYGTRWMPLLQVLDEEGGIGFDGAAPVDEPLLADLPLQPPPPPRPLTARDRLLLARMPRWQGADTWELSDADLEALAAPEPQPFPASFAALACLSAADAAALDRGDFRFWMEQYSGPTAARWLGRFAGGDPALAAALREHLRREEAARPEALFAEVVHVPEGRMGNVLARPALRDHEIPFLATPGVPEDRGLPPSDLRVTVRGRRVVLASARLGREVVPRLSSAHNFARGPAVYRFLAHLQEQDGRSGGWSWGALADLPFLPRVVRGRHVLARARWRIGGGELAGGPWEAVQALRQRRGLPRFVTLAEADHHLRVDLDQPLAADMLHHQVAGRAAFTLLEGFPAPGEALVTGPEGRFAHELVVPFEAAGPAARPLPPPGGAALVRAFAPGSEWLYLKLYAGPATADRLLVDLAPLLAATGAEGLWDRWHFLRYRDPGPHLRLRFHGEPGRLLAALLPRLHGHLAPWLAAGLLWKWQVDTFEPEWERYGGPAGFPLAEAWFAEDSQRVLDRLVAGAPPEDRWREGLRDTDAIWAALGLEIPERLAVARRARDAFRTEFAATGAGSAPVGDRFRRLRRELEAGFPCPPDTAGRPEHRALVPIREACARGDLQEDRASLAGSLVHMHLNRLLRTRPREHEWVLMEFLVRLYASHLARNPRSDS